MNRHHRPRRSASGFTLVEVMVALLIMAVMAGLAWRGMDSIARTRSVTEGRMEQAVRVDAVLGQWEQDLLALQETDQVPTLSFDGLSLRLVRRTETGLQLVVWSVRQGHWLRWTSAPVTRAAALQDAWMRSQQLLGNEPQQLRTLDGVTGWQVYFYRGNAWTNPQSSPSFVTVVSGNPPSGGGVPTSGSGAASGTGTGNNAGNGLGNGQGTGQGSGIPTKGGAGTPTQKQLLPTGVRLVISFEGSLSGNLTRDVLLGPQS